MTRMRWLLLLCAISLAVPVHAETTKIVFATYSSGSGTPAAWQSLIDRFTEANPDIEVEVLVFTFGEYVDKIMTMTAGGTAPDVFQTWAQNKPQWVEMGLVKDLTDLWEGSPVLAQTEFYPFMLDAAMYQGRYYGVPYDFNAVVWFHNADWMQERGLAEPDTNWTVEEFAARARKLMDQEKQVYATHNRNNAATALSIQWVYNWTGHEWLSDDRTEVLLEDPGVAEMLEFWRDLQVNQHVIPYAGGFSPRTFDQGGYAITEQYMSLAFSLEQASFDWVVSLLPKAPHAQQSHAQAHMFSVASGTHQPDAAWRLVEWMASYEGQQAMVEILQRQPLGPYPELWDAFFGRLSPQKADYLRNWVMNTLYGQNYIYNFQYWETWPEMQTIMNDHLRRIFNEGVPIANELSAAAQRLRGVMEAGN